MYKIIHNDNTPNKSLFGGVVLKKRGFIFILLILCIGTSFSLAANYLNKVEGYERDFSIVTDKGSLSLQEKPVIINNRIYLPLKNIAEILEYKASWNEAAETVTLLKPNLEEILPPCNPFDGEYFIYGEIRGIDFQKYLIYIEQHIDDNSKEVFGDLQLQEDAALVLQRNSHFMKINFKDLKVGDIVGLVLTIDDEIRGMIIDG